MYLFCEGKVKLTIGAVAYKNLKYTKLFVDSIKKTVKHPFDFFIVDGYGKDETWDWIDQEKIPAIKHDKNYGAVHAVNDIFDHAFEGTEESLLLMCGNDVMAYPGAVDNMIRLMELAKPDWVWANEMRTEMFASLMPRYQDERYFDSQLRLKPDKFPEYTQYKFEKTEEGYYFNPVRDYRNFTLISSRLFDKIGYADVSFYPSGYYEDNDYCLRAHLAGAQAILAKGSWFYHFWNRSIVEADVNIDQVQKSLNIYLKKWGSDVGKETFPLPYMDEPLAKMTRDGDIRTLGKLIAEAQQCV